MPLVPANDFISWKERQISKGGDHQSLDHLIDSVGGCTKEKYHLIKLSLKKNIELKVNLEKLESLWNQHLNMGIPVQYLSGISYWRDLKLEVSENVLIPRSETELIIEIVQESFKQKFKEITFVDLGTGSGAIGIALALAKPFWNGIATDIDKNAIQIASKNFARCSDKSLSLIHI